MEEVRLSPALALMMTSPCFFVSEPPALSMARMVCFCQPMAVIISSSVVPPLSLSIAITWLVLLSGRGTLAFVAPLGALFARVALLFAHRRAGIGNECFVGHQVIGPVKAPETDIVRLAE